MRVAMRAADLIYKHTYTLTHIRTYTHKHTERSVYSLAIWAKQ